MGANDRIVQHLRLRAPSQQAATRVVNRLEDALRCASLPDAGERLLLVRRLDLGRLPAGGSSQSLSLLIEQRVMALGGTWVHGEQASADESDTVYFVSRLQAAQVALRRRAEGRSLGAWYWRSALPGVQIEAGNEEFLHSVIALLAQETAAPACVPALVADIVAAGHAAWLIRHMPGEASWPLLAISGAQRHLATIEHEWTVAVALQSVAQASGTEASRQIVLRYRDAGRPGSHAVAGLRAPVWLHAILRAAHWLPAGVVVTSTAAQPESSSLAGPPASHPPDPAQAAPHSASPQRQGDTPGAQTPVAPDAVGESQPIALQRQAVEIRPVEPDRMVGESGSFAPLIQMPCDDLAPTGVGGLLFLINVLERLGFGEWQGQHADMPIAGQMFRQVLRRLHVPSDDAAWSMVGSLPLTSSEQSACWEAPVMWNDVRIAIAHNPGREMRAGDIAERWRMACGRYLRRIARIGMASLCLRPARVHWSATHLGTRFALAAVDLRVRRVALDIDPGWLDWLQRVVSFEYTNEDQA